jgi:hyperosmotically inducible periplasmic protein
MNLRFALGGAALSCLLCLGPVASFGQQPPAPDNTRENKRDRSAGEPTADQGKNNASDRDMMQKIRRSILDDKELSTYAHNVKVVAEHGKVTLKGPVRSEEEKKTIEQKAAEVAGAGNVNSQITIKPAKEKKTS